MKIKRSWGKQINNSYNSRVEEGVLNYEIPKN